MRTNLIVSKHAIDRYIERRGETIEPWYVLSLIQESKMYIDQYGLAYFASSDGIFVVDLPDMTVVTYYPGKPKKNWVCMEQYPHNEFAGFSKQLKHITIRRFGHNVNGIKLEWTEDTYKQRKEVIDNAR